VAYRLLSVLVAASLTGSLSAQQASPPPNAIVEPPQMIVLLVDLQTKQGDERQSAVLSAQTALGNMWAGWNVGLAKPYLFAVKTLGSRVETVQDFTWNPDLVYAALLKVAAEPSTPITASNDRTEALSAMCGELARSTSNASQFAGLEALRIPEVPSPSVPKAVYYYDRSTSFSPDALASVQALANACRRPNVLFLISLSLETRPLPPPVGLSVRIVPHQAGSPVSIVESGSPLDAGYMSVVLRNDADKAIRSVTLAALAEPMDPALATPQIFTRRGPSVTILPRGTAEIAAQLLDLSTMDTLARKGANVEIGVTGVEFADGSTWTYDLAAKGRFER